MASPLPAPTPSSTQAGSPGPSIGEVPRRRSIASLPPLAPFFDARRVRAVELRKTRPGWLARMRVRKKLIVIHSVCTLVLAAALLLTLRPAVTAVVREAEVEKAVLLLSVMDAGELSVRAAQAGLVGEGADAGVGVRIGDGAALGLEARDAERAVARWTASAGGDWGAAGFVNKALLIEPVRASVLGHGAIRVVADAGGRSDGNGPRFALLAAEVPDARIAVSRLYVFVVAALLAIYLLVALALEIFVLPQNVYGPIQRMLDADDALASGRRSEELVDEALMPKDEMGEIMRSRNRSIAELRRKEAALGEALSTLEEVATDLKRKNHLLEAAKRNLQDADRLASLGMMSAGIAHELNTPLAVVKGLAERLAAHPEKRLEPADAALMLRVVHRLEGLGESLLDYARVRSPRSVLVSCGVVVDEAITLVRLDRDAGEVQIDNRVPEGLMAMCDADRMVQVFVNLIRNAVDALRESESRDGGERPRVDVLGETIMREGRGWIALRIRDNGPGIDPQILTRLFEPFASTRLDSKGTGLGLAVAEGIVREHGGVLLATNRTDRSGAMFEVLLPG